MTSDKPFLGLHVSIARWTDDSQPGWVECLLTDARGKVWSFLEKAPVVSAEDLDARSSYPRSGLIACRVVERWIDEAGREMLRVDTSTPWGIEATSGETRFEVFAPQVVDIALREASG
jgi:hypothetical protein